MSIRPAREAQQQRFHHPDPSALEVVLFHDVLCSWCYIADERLAQLRAEYGGAVRWSLRAYPLRPENQLPDKKERSQFARHFRKLAREEEGKGVKPDLWTGQDPPASSLPPLLALEAALSQGEALQHQLLRSLRRAAFVEGINVARRDVQLELAAQAGLDLPRLISRLDDPQTALTVEASVEEAEALGIKGVPALVIGAEWLMQGCRETSEYRQVIDKYLRERASSPAELRILH